MLNVFLEQKLHSRNDSLLSVIVLVLQAQHRSIDINSGVSFQLKSFDLEAIPPPPPLRNPFQKDKKN